MTHTPSRIGRVWTVVYSDASDVTGMSVAHFDDEAEAMQFAQSHQVAMVNEEDGTHSHSSAVDADAEAVVTADDIDPGQLCIVIDELTSALIGAVALGAHAMEATATEAAALNGAIRRATATLRCLQLRATLRRRR